jgi:hypothetical protein
MRCFPLRVSLSVDNVKLRQNVGIGGFTYRPASKLSFSAEGESASSGGAYFRTSLYDYQKVRAQARYHTRADQLLGGFQSFEQPGPATRHQLRLFIASGIALGHVVAGGRQSVRFSG